MTTADPFFVSPIGAKTEQIQYGFNNELPPPVNRATEETMAVTLGVKTDLWGDWRSDSFLNFSQEIEENRTNGILNTTILAEALGNVADRTTTAYSPARDGFFNPFTAVDGNTPAVLAAIGSGYQVTRSRNRVLTASAQADGSVFDLPAGPVKLAVGGQARLETFIREGSNYATTVAPVAAAGTDVDRTVGALFAEAHVPLFGPENRRPGFERLEVSLAARWEHYTGFGGTLNPKVGVLWSPVRTSSSEAPMTSRSARRACRNPAIRSSTRPATSPSARAMCSD